MVSDRERKMWWLSLVSVPILAATAAGINAWRNIDDYRHRIETDIAQGAPALLDFTVPTLNLAPDDVVSAPFAIRLDATTTNPANAVISAPVGGTSGSLAGLTYSLTQTEEFGCDQDVSETLVAAGTAVGTVAGAPSVPLAVGADDAAGDAVYVCFTVTADGALVEGQSGTATWQFLATSVDVTP